MMKFWILLLLIWLVTPSVSAMEFTAPAAPEQAQKYMPQDTESFSEGLWEIIKAAATELRPELADAAGICISILAVLLLVSLVRCMSDAASSATDLAGICMISLSILQSSRSLIQLGLDTVNTLTQYAKLLLPVMTAATAAQGSIGTSAALCTGTSVFISILTSLCSGLFTPLLYTFIALSIAGCALGGDILQEMNKFIKWLLTWLLKITIYVFTGYMSITGVVSGSADAAALKATKLTISGMVPVVGSIIADASESVLVGAGLMRNAAGVYGILASLAILVGPFLKVGIHYLLLKLTAGVGAVFGTGNTVTLVRSFSSAMGYVLALIGVTSIMLLISTVCFMKAVSG